MKSIGVWIMQTLLVLLISSFVAGCFVGEWHRDYPYNNGGMRNSDRGDEGDWDSDRKTNRDRDGRQGAEQSSMQYSREHSGDPR